jgi:hypothetical protein
MPPTNTENPRTNKPDKKNRIKISSAKKLLAVILPIILIAGAGYWLVSRNSRSFGSQAYAYKKLDAYEVKDETTGSRVSFKKPQEFQLAATYYQPRQIVLMHRGQSKPYIGLIAEASLQDYLPQGADFFKNYNNVITDPKNPSYKELIKPLEDYIDRQAGAGFTGANLSVPKAFSSSNITTGAWSADFTDTYKGSAKVAPYKLQGRIIEAYGKKSVFYFMAANVGSVWEKNDQVWQQIFNSLRIDQ